MKTFRLLALVLVAVPILLPAQHKKKPTTPAIFANARYVYVECPDGDEFAPGLYEGDRQAIQDVEQAIQAWGRYMLTTDRKQAELLFVVRKGRLASARIGGTTGSGPGGGSGPARNPNPGQTRTEPLGASLDTDIGSPDDMLDVHILGADGKVTASVWTRSMTDGLQSPDVPLLRNLKTAVEKDYPK